MEFVSSEMPTARMNRTFPDTLPERLPGSQWVVPRISERFDRQVNAAMVGQIERLVERQLALLHRGKCLCLHWTFPFACLQMPTE